MTKRANPMVTVGGDSRDKDVPVNAIGSAVSFDVRPILFNDDAVRIVVLHGDVMFVASDVTAVLGYGNSSAAVAKHCKAPITITKREGGFLTVIPERDVYRLVVRSKLPAAERFEEWLVGEVLPSIRRTSSYSMSAAAPDPTPPAPLARSQVTLAGEIAIGEMAARLLNMSESAKLALVARIAKAHSLGTGFLPSYAIDAPTDSTSATSEESSSATALLARHGRGMSAAQLNVALARLGYLRKCKRDTSRLDLYPDGMKSFWKIEGPGLMYGKNIIDPQSPRETKPQWFVSRFADLLDIVRNANEGGV